MMTTANKLMPFAIHKKYHRVIGELDETSSINVHNLQSTHIFVVHHSKVIECYFVKISAFRRNYLSAERNLIEPLVTFEH